MQYSPLSQLPDSPLPNALATLSKPRIDAYRDFLKLKTDESVLSFYLWSQAMAAAFSPLIGFIEIALRNKIHEALSLHHSAGSSISAAWYDQTQTSYTRLKGKTLAKVDELLYDSSDPQNIISLTPTPDKVVSELSFGVWSDILQQIRADEAAHVFTHVFPNHPKSKKKHWSFSHNREPLIRAVKRVQALRNRICHYEPIWKAHFLDIEVAHWSGSVQALRNMGDEFIELLDWISPELKKIFSNSFAFDWFNKLCSTNAVLSFLENSSDTGKLEKIIKPALLVEKEQPQAETAAKTTEAINEKAVSLTSSALGALPVSPGHDIATAAPKVPFANNPEGSASQS